MAQGLEAISLIRKGIAIIEKELSTKTLDAEETQILQRQRSSALVSIAEIYLTDCW